MKKKTIVSSILTIVLCLSLIAGSTYALFTSKDEVNIAVSSGKVEVKAVLKNLHYASELGDGTTLEGSSAVITEEDRLLTLTNIVPGDYVTFDIVITNNSTVAINYRTVIQMLNDTGLWAGLKVTIGANEAGEAVVYDGTHSYANWAQLLPESEDIVVPVKISLPVEAEDKYQDKSCKISYRVEAVQGNAPVVDPYTYKDGVYYINSEEGMMLMNQILATVPHNEGIAINFALTADMDMTGYTWAPIRAHWVNIDGQGHKVSNLTCTTNEVAKSGFVGYLGAGTIKNITLENVTVAGEQAGVLVGQVEAGTIENVTIAGTNTVSYYDDPAYDEQWSGVGAVIGVDVSGNTDKTGVTIAEGATISIAYNGFKTQLAGPANEFAFNLAINVTNNGTVTTEGNAICMENGLEMVYEDGEKILYLVPADYAEETVVVPEGVTAIGNYAFAYNSNVKTVILADSVRDLGRGFDTSTVEKVVLNEGLEVISSRAFRSTSALKEVVISSTVKEIADNAFQKTALKTITIPANVETIGEAAFGASKIETVIFDGNTSIQGYAFRGCPELHTVYLKGDDVTFIPSTLNGRNSMWFCNGESNNPNTSDIDFYVVNETVAARVKAAMGAEANNTDVIIVNSLASNGDELVESLENGKDVLFTNDVKINPAGMSNAYGTTGINVKNGQTIDGNGNILDIKGAGGTWDSGISTTGGLIKNITVTGSFRGIFINHNSEHSEKVVLENVIIDGTTYTISCDQGTGKGLEATNSTFKGWTSYATTLGNAKFVDCYFGAGNGYSYCRPYAPTTFVGCTFEEGYTINPRANIVLVDCYYGKTLITEENIESLNLISGDMAKVAFPASVSGDVNLNDVIANNGGYADLADDVQYGNKILGDVNLNLNENAFEATGTIELSNNSNLTMSNGDYVVNGTYGHVDVRPDSAEGSVVTFENVDFSYNKKGPSYGPSTNRLGTVVEVCATVEGAKTVIVFKNCTFDNAQVLFEGMSGKTGEFEATFENCTFKALTSSAPIYVQNYVKGTINVIGCTFNLECTSSTASAISVSSSSSTSVVVNAKDNTINATAATPTDSSVTGVDVVKVNGTPANIKFVSISGTTSSVNEENTTKTGIAG